MRTPPLLAVLAAAALLAGCAAGPATTGEATTAPNVPAEGVLPSTGTVDYQLGGAAEPADDVSVVVRDRTDPPAGGDVVSICYVNGFQTQPGERDEWLAERPGAVLMADGEPVIDPGWPDELLLDVSTPENRELILDTVGAWIDGCAEDGYDAVEIDNLDLASRAPDGAVAEEDVLELAAAYAERAHDAGIGIAQKNAPALAERLRNDLGYDLAIAEECHRFEECAAYAEAYGDQVIDVEYDGDLRGSFPDVCADPDTPRLVVLRDLDLVVPEDPAYVRETC